MNDEFESWLNTSPIPVIYRQYSDNKDDVLDFLTLLKYPNLYIPNTYVVISLEFLHKILGNKMSKINWCDNLTVNESELHPVTNNVQNQYASLPLTATDSVNTRNKHKWYDVIVAWAEGKEIQFRPMGKSDHIWSNYPLQKSSPDFNIETYEWRIKPEKKNKFDPYFYECDNEYQLDVMSLHRDHVSLSQKELAQVLFELNQKNAELLEEKNEHEYSDDEYFWNGLDEL